MSVHFFSEWIADTGLKELSISFCFDCETCVYICVTLIELCPSICWIYRISTFLSSNIVAKLCLNICGVIVLDKLFCSTILFKIKRTLCSDNGLSECFPGNKKSFDSFLVLFIYVSNKLNVFWSPKNRIRSFLPFPIIWSVLLERLISLRWMWQSSEILMPVESKREIISRFLSAFCFW